MTDPALRHDIWLSDVLERPCYELLTSDLASRPLDLTAVLAEARGTTAAFIFARLAPGDLTMTRRIQAEGFVLIETNVTLGREVSIGSVSTNLAVREACAMDREAVAEVARSSFSVSRFHRDPAFSKELADNLNAHWAENFFLGKRGDRLLVCENNGQVNGFVSLLDDPSRNRAVIDLVAVASSARRNGIASALIDSAMAGIAGKFAEIHVGTQLENTAAMTFYQRRGFRVLDAKYMFHLHLDTK